MNDDDRRSRETIPDWWVTAYALEELSPSERDLMVAAMARDKSLIDAVEAARARAKEVREALLYQDAKDGQADHERRVSRQRRVMWMALAALALLALGSLVILNRDSFDEREDTILITPREPDAWAPGSSQRMESTPSEPEVRGGKNPDVASASDGGDQPRDTRDSRSVFEEDGPMEVEGPLDTLTVKMYLRRYLVGVRGCYESRLTERPELAGRMTLVFQIGPAGAVSGASIERSTLGDPELDECMLTKMARWRFPQPRGGGWVKVSFPIRLSPIDDARGTRDKDTRSGAED